MKIRASLESVKSRKLVTEDIGQVVTFSVYGEPVDIAKLNALYKLPLEIEIRVVEG